jgi:1-acyl-sn-glycerol-3-phosphate acyltransferase
LSIFFSIFTKLDVRGLNHIPSTGHAIICSNHLSIFDSPLIFIHLTRDDATALVATKHRSNLLMRLVVNAAGGTWLNRDFTDPQAIRTAVNILKSGGILGIAPEGTRSVTGGLLPGKPGVAYLADKAEAPIAPIAIEGTESILSSFHRFKRPRVTLTVGPPFSLPKVERKTRAEDFQRNTDEIMCQIAVLLAPKYRGVYADHPRLKEIESHRLLHAA